MEDLAERRRAGEVSTMVSMAAAAALDLGRRGGGGVVAGCRRARWIQWLRARALPCSRSPNDLGLAGDERRMESKRKTEREA